MTRENEHIFGSERQLGVAFHNVGENGVLHAINSDVATTVGHKYELRGGHIPDAKQIGVLANPTRETRGQMEYLSAIYGQQVSILTKSDLNAHSLVVPYINSTACNDHLSSSNAEVWGLPPKMVDTLRDKAKFHEKVEEYGIDGFKVPDFTVSTIENSARAAFSVLKDTENKYKSVGLEYKPFGVMLRAAASDGGYGSAVVQRVKDRVQVLHDGEISDNQKTYEDSRSGWNEALDDAQKHLSNGLDSNKENKVVISRLMDLEDSPGLSLICLKGEILSLGWNGQVKANGGTACLGTTKYEAPSEYARHSQKRYEQKTAQSFGQFLQKSSQDLGINFNEISGIANVDIMIPGPMEREYQKRMGNDPDAITVAETNPRFTNLTDAVLAVARAEKRSQTYHNMKDVLNSGILTIDRYPVPVHKPIEQVRETIFELDQNLRSGGTRVILRMPTKPNAGVIFSGDVKKAKHALDRRLQ